MYVMPFWSWRRVNAGLMIINHLSGMRRTLGPDALDVIEDIHRTGADRTAEVEGLAELEIVLDSEQALDERIARLAADGREFPVVDQIELTNRCPYRCEMCPRTHFMTRETGDLDIDLFARIIAEVAPHQDYLGLHHFGESLLHPKLPKAVAIAKAAGVSAGISCNPPSLRPELGQQLLEAGLANMVVSLDSVDADIYRSIRGRAARFAAADRNLRALIERRNVGGHELAVTAQMIRMDANQGEEERFLAYCQEVGVDRAVVIRLGRWDFDPEYIERIGTVDAPGYTTPCYLPWRSVAVLWDGRVVPCAHDYDGFEVLGDLREQTLAEVWRSPRMKAFQAGNASNPLCAKCSFSAWYRKGQREREGFREFHREYNGHEVAVEWINPDSRGWRDGRRYFDRFDIVPSEV